ncbi:hypothetical protein QR680_015818 [Steinernema hermaphroditum]|uniref:Uncharacterized protein n=1 Tax=Steinernema hermaphroditum TaxID=289476 RepID=A0AA39H9B1_9BILA|nr:hypothetical protein QR680_015818 [Steinernema hermaphroditum]
MKMKLFALVCFLLCSAPIKARPENLVASAFISTDGERFYNQLSSEEKQKYDQINILFQDLIQAGIVVGLHDFVNIAKHKTPQLYEKLAEFEKRVDNEEKALPLAVKKFIKDRRSEVKDWFINGNLDTKAFARSLKLTAVEINLMSDVDRTALFKYYPHMETLLQNAHFKQFLDQPDDVNEDLRAVLDSTPNNETST